jgi:predicted Zn-dependent protease
MYKAPIEICRTIEDIIQKVVEETDNQVYEAVCRVGVNVDKEELIKALRYDRGQYEKGYADGVRDFAERLKQSAFDCDVSFGYGKEHYTEAVAVVEIDNLVKEIINKKH